MLSIGDLNCYIMRHGKINFKKSPTSGSLKMSLRNLISRQKECMYSEFKLLYWHFWTALSHTRNHFVTLQKSSCSFVIAYNIKLIKHKYATFQSNKIDSRPEAIRDLSCQSLTEAAWVCQRSFNICLRIFFWGCINNLGVYVSKSISARHTIQCSFESWTS